MTTQVRIGSVDDFGLSAEDGGKWVLMCSKHNEFIQDTNKKRLAEWKNDPSDWCESCRDEKVIA